MFKSRKSHLTWLLAALLPGLVGCPNLFSVVDKPQGDAQLISAARACLDRGDIPCALADYQKLSNKNSDIANSESAAAILEKYGVGVVDFAGAVSGGKTPGDLVN